MDHNETLAIKKEIESKIFETPGVFAVGIGLNSEKGENEYKIIVYVSKDSSVETLKTRALSSNSDLTIDFIVEPAVSDDVLYLNEEGEEEYHIYNRSGEEIEYTPPCRDYNKYNPIIGGIQLYLHDSRYAWFGTLGTIVQSKDSSDTNKYILSNNHVLQKKGLECFQPDGSKRNMIGKVVFDTDFSNSDAALAVLNDNIEFGNKLIQDVGEISGWAKVDSSLLEKRVLKRGRTTLVTEGTITAISVTLNVGEISREDCVIVTADSDTLFSTGGDSGSPVVLKDDHTLVGLHFAGNSTFGGISVFCTIENVFNNLNIQLID